MPIEGHSDVPLRFDFVVPIDVDVAETTEGDVFATEKDENVRLGTLRRALETDSRWRQYRVASIQAADTGEWHVMVWLILASADEQDVEDARGSVPDLVRMIIPGTRLVSIDRSRR
jgi:hypothetical protein